jgi:hypothetical protein
MLNGIIRKHTSIVDGQCYGAIDAEKMDEEIGMEGGRNTAFCSLGKGRTVTLGAV